MVLICHWHNVRQWQRARKLRTWRENHRSLCSTVGKAIWFMISGFLGSAIVPLFVFAPVLLVQLGRWIRRDEYAAA